MKKETLHEEVKQLILELIEKKQVSQQKLSEMLGVSSATISNIINDRHDRFQESMLLKIKAYFNTKDWNLIETSNFANIQKQCDQARYRHCLIGIVGYSGAGKTTALQNYYATNTDTFMVTCGRSMRTKQLLAEILKALGVNYVASDYEMVRMVIEELNKRENPLLIIDEASKLSSNALMYIQDIHDGTDNNAGIIIAGVDYLLTNLKKNADRNKAGMPEFYGRVALWQHLDNPTRKEIEAVCTNNGLDEPSVIRDIVRLGNFRQVRNSILNHIN